MRQVIVAFERQSNREKLRELLEGSGEFSCLLCHSGAQVKRAVSKLRPGIIVCGFKLADESCEALYADLPPRCAMLMVAPQNRLELCETEGIFKLPAPIRRAELLASLRMLAQFTRGPGHSPAQRTAEERALVEQAKAVLMDRHAMTEEQAHRFLQKTSMDHGARLADTARWVLEDT